MKGFIITHNEEQIKIGVEDGLTLINFWYSDPERNYIDITVSDYKEKQKNKWVSFAPININDRWKIEFTEIDSVSPPVKSVKNDNIQRPVIDKLAEFRRLENELKEKGLL